MELGGSPASVSSRRRVVYRKSSWSTHQFDVWCGDLVCRVAVLRGEGWLLLWVGDAEPRLTEVALALPTSAGSAPASTTLLGGEGTAVALARRLASRLACPVYVCLGAVFDRFTYPLVERGLILEIKSRPQFF